MMNKNILTIYSDKKTSNFLEAHNLHSNFNFTNKKKDFDIEIKLTKNVLQINAFNQSSLDIDVTDLDMIRSLLDSINKTNTNSSSEIDKYSIRPGKNLKDSLNNIAAHTELLQYSNLQLLIHPNGSTNALSISFKHNEYHLKDISVVKFDSIYKKIKQSKNKSFDQSEIKADDLDLVGSFLAKEIASTKFNFIVLLSKGDFFPPEEGDQENFERIIIKNKNILDNQIGDFLINLQIERIKDILLNFPIEIDIYPNENGIKISHHAIQSDTNFFHQERLELMGELLNTLRHELSNPLFGINISSSLLKTDSIMTDESYFETIDEIANSSMRCQKIIENFSHLYDPDEEIKDINLYQLIKETIVLTKSSSKFYQPRIELLNISEDFKCKMNQTLLSQILFNLIINSSQALKDIEQKDKRILIKVRKREEALIISVIDNGPGIYSGDHDIFQAFYTTKQHGTGLGLTICRNICSKINAELCLDKEYKDGAKFDIIFKDLIS